MPTDVTEFVKTFVQADSEDDAAHYGVPGMKWGQRKRRGSSSSGSSHAKTSSKTTHPHAKHLSDTELKERIGRLKLEKEYKQLTTPPPSAGRKFINELLVGTGKTIATKYAAEYGTKAVAMAIAKATAKTAVKAAL